MDGQVISTGELFSKAQYICYMQENSNYYWKQQSLQHNTIVTTRTSIHQRLDVVIMRDVQDIPKNVCNRIQ